MHTKAVLFHLESTLVRPTRLDINRINASIGCPAETTTIDFLDSLSKAADRSQAQSSLDRLELDAALDSKSPPGTLELLRYLELKGLHLAVFSHGSPAFVDLLLKNLAFGEVFNFFPIISRKELLATTPAIHAVQLAAQKLKLAPDQILVVTADSIVNQQAQNAGAISVLFDPSIKRQKPGMRIKYHN